MYIRICMYIYIYIYTISTHIIYHIIERPVGSAAPAAIVVASPVRGSWSTVIHASSSWSTSP